MKETSMQDDWRSRAGTRFSTEKRPATGTRGMVVTNHPLASAAGAEMLAAGGNAVDGAIAALFALTVVEPMMVGILGGGMAHLRLPDGRHTVIDGLSTAPAAARAASPHAPPRRRRRGSPCEAGSRRRTWARGRCTPHGPDP
jgi:gamma-glutamyltranspeptidase